MSKIFTNVRGLYDMFTDRFYNYAGLRGSISVVNDGGTGV